MTTKSVYRPDYDDDRGNTPVKGEHYFCSTESGRPKWMVFGCRRPENNKTGICQIALRPQKNGVGASWEFDGNKEAPTIHPSVDCSRVCGAHFFIRNGEYTE